MAEIRKYIEGLNEELNAAALYRALAGLEKHPKIADVYRRLAETEEKHAAFWVERIKAAGGKVPEFKAAGRTRVLVWVAKRFGANVILPALSATELRNLKRDAGDPEAAVIAKDDRSHAMLLQQISRSSGTGLEGSAVAQIEGRHRSAGGNALRAAVLGASDGLVSNFNLVMGVAGAALSNSTILLTGFAGLLAGAISMALGEWISVKSSRELYEKQIATEKAEIEEMPEEELEELVLIYQARGMSETTARTLAGEIMGNPNTALDTLVRDELGIDPEELGGSAWEAAITSFLLFVAGAIVPVIPFMFLSALTAVAASALFSTVGLFVLGAATTLFTGRGVFHSGMRQVLFGLAAAAAVYGIGHLIGVGLA